MHEFVNTDAELAERTTFANIPYSETCVRQLRTHTFETDFKTVRVDEERLLFYKGTCHVILLAKLHDMYLYKTATFPHQPLKSVSKVALLHRSHCTCFGRNRFLFMPFIHKILCGMANSVGPEQQSNLGLHCLHMPFSQKVLGHLT